MHIWDTDHCWFKKRDASCEFLMYCPQALERKGLLSFSPEIMWTEFAELPRKSVRWLYKFTAPTRKAQAVHHNLLSSNSHYARYCIINPLETLRNQPHQKLILSLHHTFPQSGMIHGGVLFHELPQYSWQAWEIMSAHLDSRRRTGKFRSWCHEQQHDQDRKTKKKNLDRFADSPQLENCLWLHSVLGIWGSSHMVEESAPLSPLCDVANNKWSVWFQGTDMIFTFMFVLKKTNTFSYGTVSWLDVCVWQQFIYSANYTVFTNELAILLHLQYMPICGFFC